MRITVTLDADTESQLRRRMGTEVVSFKQALNDAIRAGLSGHAEAFATEVARHLTLVRGLLAPLGAGGNLVNHAHLAALALVHRGTVIP